MKSDKIVNFFKNIFLSFLNFEKSFYYFSIIVFILGYVFYVKLSYFNFFMDMHFVHVPFFNDLLNYEFNLANFMTLCGEHFTAGYNILKSFDVLLFGISGPFDPLLSTLTAISIFLVCSYYLKNKFFKINKQPNWINSLSFVFAGLTLLSPIKNIVTTMSLSAAMGVLLFVIFSFYFDKFVIYNKTDNSFRMQFNFKSLIFLNLFLFINIVLFTGAYSAGIAGSIFLLFFIFITNKYTTQIYFFISTLVFSFVVYFLLLNYVSPYPLGYVRIIGDWFNIDLIPGFFLRLLGSSILGKAFFENTNFIWLHYFYGILFLVGYLLYLFKSYQNKSNINIFLFLLINYGFVNIFIISIFRSHIGDSLGTWYPFHIQFIPFCLFLFFIKNKNTYNKFIIILLFFIPATIGYIYEMAKGRHIPGWRENYFNQIPSIMAFNEDIPNIEDEQFTMLMDLPRVNEGLNFLYKNKLWIFGQNKSINFYDYTNNIHYAICPIDTISTEITFHFDRSYSLIFNDNELIMNGLNEKFLDQKYLHNFVKKHSDYPIYRFNTNGFSGKFKMKVKCF